MNNVQSFPLVHHAGLVFFTIFLLIGVALLAWNQSEKKCGQDKDISVEKLVFIKIDFNLYDNLKMYSYNFGVCLGEAIPNFAVWLLVLFLFV
ncbi:transmembrane protein, putative [Medicago truncatula]|uniref:Transmembrane protein, putative n=1 Tax=Medicago truncatula TaxID=3880 RepID=A0A072U562_MEDTR|nr:transmembrane protein, putative [Medicago truncatula]